MCFRKRIHSTTMKLHLGQKGVAELRLVTEYVHLGCSLDRGATMKFEALRRVAIKGSRGLPGASAATVPECAYPAQCERHALLAMVDATMFNLEIWGRPEGAAWDRLQAGHARLLKRLLVKEVTSEQLLALLLSDMVALTEHPPLTVMLHAKRLRYMITLVRGAASPLWALLHAERQWQSQCVADLCWLRAHDPREWPVVDEAHWPEWWALMSGQAGAFRRGIGRATRAAAASFALQGVFRRVTDGMKRDAYRAHPQAFQTECAAVWVCGPCKKVFERKANLACHFFKSHQRQAECRFFLEGAICTACGRDYVTEDRLQRHLWHQKTCWRTVQGQGAKTQTAGPGIGSRQWHALRREKPILHPPVPADLYVIHNPDQERAGETPGAALIRKCTGVLGEWIAECDDAVTFEAFAGGCAAILADFPLYTEEMKDVLRAAIADVELCLDEDLLEWSIAQSTRLLGWLRHFLACASGRWLCEWVGIALGSDVGPYRMKSDGISAILKARGSRLRSCSQRILVGSSRCGVERTHGLATADARLVDWNELDHLGDDEGCAVVEACLDFPGEAKAGGAKSSFALSHGEASGVFTLARALLELEPFFRGAWRAFLRGFRVVLSVRPCRL